ncbi:MAG: NAD(P)/FAD-dependent oxidoreductase [Bacteroidales bacterium]|nr:NAD(P)/FAD-dependent oxidoreductase [Bacteroidales bacterium]
METSLDKTENSKPTRIHDNRVIVIGGGASGMMAAYAAAQRGREVIMLEKMGQPGLKLRITGKGRCNLTNTSSLKDFLTHVGSDPRFMRNSFSQFFNTHLMQFFEDNGVPLVVERGERVYPKSGKSLDIFLAIITALEKMENVEIRRNCRVDSLIIEDGAACGVRCADGTVLRASSIVLATGGMSYPLTGSTGDGYRLAEQAGHSLSPRYPALVHLECELKIPQELVDFPLKNVRLTLTRPDGKKISDNFGEMTFTPNGIGGPIVLSASRQATAPLHKGESVIAHIDFKPAVEKNTLDKRLINDLNSSGNRLFHDALRLWLPAELIPLALQHLHIEYYKRLNQINSAERHKLLNFLKDFSFELTGTGSFEEAIVTQGGVCLKEVNPKTMESKIVDGLYITGEVLDLDADTGGYNLQIAFTTGYAAGSSC